MSAYDLDYDALTKVAARINAPTLRRSQQRGGRASVRKDSGHLAFRTFGFWH